MSRQCRPIDRTVSAEVFVVRSKIRVLQREIGSLVLIEFHHAHSDPIPDQTADGGHLDGMCASKGLTPRSGAGAGAAAASGLHRRYSKGVPSALR